MKKLRLKSKILLAAFMVSGLAAGATEVAKAMLNSDDSTYNWTHFNRQGQQIGSLADKSVADARTMLGCPGTVSTTCATGVRNSGTGSPNETIFYD